jgi:glycosyltransferase involved in cell wall biosynthesis
MKINLAIISPSQNSYSESFIQAHRQLDANVFFYYGGFIPDTLEREGRITDNKIQYLFYSILKSLGIIKKSNFKLFALKKSLKNNNIQVVLAEYGPTAANIFSICKSLNIPLIVHFHGYDATAKYVLKKYSYIYRQMFDYSYKIIVVSKKMISDIELLGASIDKIFYNVYGPSDIYFSNSKKSTLRQFVSVGRFVEKKAPHLTILAFKKVLKNFPDATLIMGGEGPLLSICKQLVSALGLNNRVIFKGIVTQSEILTFFSESICFVQHSITSEDGDCEGTPVAILEAMAAALPVISTTHAGISDIVTHQKTGLLVNEFDVDGMAQNMEYLLRNPDIAFKMGDEGKRIVELNYNLKRHLDCLNEIIYNSCK